jgi:hypothetical protein
MSDRNAILDGKMIELARRVEAEAMNVLGVALDYSEASLRHIDHLISVRVPNRPVALDTLTSDAQHSLWGHCLLMAAYVGEVVLRNLGAAWQEEQLASGEVRVKLLVVGQIAATPANYFWRSITEPYRGLAVSFYEGLLATLEINKHELKSSGGSHSVSVRELSTIAPVSARGTA